MDKKYEFESDRLGFRLWIAEDSAPFASMNADSKVMQYFPGVLNKQESDKFIERIMNHFREHGYGLWAVELKATQQFIGFTGLYTALFQSEFTPCTEIGWRLDRRFWGKGYATEGALRCLDYGFNISGLDEVFSFTSQLNEPSIRVMKRAGLTEQGTFLHPGISQDSPLRTHVLYRIDKKIFRSQPKHTHVINSPQ